MSIWDYIIYDSIRNITNAYMERKNQQKVSDMANIGKRICDSLGDICTHLSELTTPEHNDFASLLNNDERCLKAVIAYPFFLVLKEQNNDITQMQYQFESYISPNVFYSLSDMREAISVNNGCKTAIDKFAIIENEHLGLFWTFLMLIDTEKDTPEYHTIASLIQEIFYVAIYFSQLGEKSNQVFSVISNKLNSLKKHEIELKNMKHAASVYTFPSECPKDFIPIVGERFNGNSLISDFIYLRDYCDNHPDDLRYICLFRDLLWECLNDNIYRKMPDHSLSEVINSKKQILGLLWNINSHFMDIGFLPLHTHLQIAELCLLNGDWGGALLHYFQLLFDSRFIKDITDNYIEEYIKMVHTVCVLYRQVGQNNLADEIISEYFSEVYQTYQNFIRRLSQKERDDANMIKFLNRTESIYFSPAGYNTIYLSGGGFYSHHDFPLSDSGSVGITYAEYLDSKKAGKELLDGFTLNEYIITKTQQNCFDIVEHPVDFVSEFDVPEALIKINGNEEWRKKQSSYMAEYHPTNQKKAIKKEKSGDTRSNNIATVVPEKMPTSPPKINSEPPKTKGCYIATAIYGSYDCPEVWTLRRYRDYNLMQNYCGRLFVKFYYAISPTLVRLFGNKVWFKKLWKRKLDKIVSNLNKNGYKNTPYND